MIAMAAIAVGFVMWQRKEKTSAVIQGVIAGRPRFGDTAERFTRMFDRSTIAVGDKVKFNRLLGTKLRQHTGLVTAVDGPKVTVATTEKFGKPGPSFDLHQTEIYERRIAGEPSDNATETVGASRPPPRPRDRERDLVILQWLQAQQSKGR